MTDYPDLAPHGWSAEFPEFRERPAPYIRQHVLDFLRSASPEQIDAWDLAIPPLQREIGEVIDQDPAAARFAAVLEYELPMEFRRPDVVLLIGGSTLVIELKSKGTIELSDVDQASAYARDLRAYHRECATTPVHAALVLMGARGRLGRHAGVEVLGADTINQLTTDLAVQGAKAVERTAFLDPDAYRPLPTIVEAARELMASGSLHRVHRAAGATAPALSYLSDVAHEAAQTKTRHLVLVSGLPGAGKTLVGLQLAHARFLDDIAIARSGGKPTAPAVYLSGNGPLVQVLQYELRDAGGGGSAFVRQMKAYVDRYTDRPDLVPPEHVVIFDEAQRAFDAAKLASTHPGVSAGATEPDRIIEFSERVPEWSVVVGLIGQGQEINPGEEAGSGQWLNAVERSKADWTVHVPPDLATEFEGATDLQVADVLHLGAELRYHLASDVHHFVDGLIGDEEPHVLARIADQMERQGFHLRMSRDLDEARAYLRDRYRDDPLARFGLIASSRDQSLGQFGIPNDWQSTKQVRYGPWFGEGDDDPLGRSCRGLRICVSEFGCQGLELDAALLAWGTDFIREQGAWTNRHARNHARGSGVRDPMRLRRNAYRVLMTRARDATVVFVPQLPSMDETAMRLSASGFRSL